jgi:hypothetical protein
MDDNNEYGWIDQALIDQYEWSCQIEDFEWEVSEEPLEEE